jgi:hypothetical protein
MEGIVLGDALLVDIKLDFLKLEDAIAKVNWEILVLEEKYII